MLQTGKGAEWPADMITGMRPLVFLCDTPGGVLRASGTRPAPTEAGTEKGKEEQNDEIYPYSGCTPGSTAGCRSAVQPSETVGTVGDI